MSQYCYYTIIIKYSDDTEFGDLYIYIYNVLWCDASVNLLYIYIYIYICPYIYIYMDKLCKNSK